VDLILKNMKNNSNYTGSFIMACIAAVLLLAFIYVALKGAGVL